MSIRLRLILAFFVCLLASTAVTCLAVFFSARNHAQTTFHALALSELQRIEEHITTFMSTGFDTIRYLASLELVQTSRGELTSYLDTKTTTTLRYADHPPHEQRIYNEFMRLRRMNNNFGLVFMANDDGQYAQAPEGFVKFAGYDPRQRSWYKELAQSDNDEAVSAPYITSGGGAVCSIMKKTYAPDGKALGMVGVDYSLKNLADALHSSSISRTGYIVLYGSDNRIIEDGAHPEYLTLDPQNYPLLRKALAASPDGEYFEQGESGETLYCVTKTIAHLNWKMSVIFDQNEVLESSYNQLYTVLISASAAALLGFILLVFIARSVVHPIEQLVEVSKIISDKEYETSAQARYLLQKKLNIKTSGETKVLAEGLRIMISTLQERIEAAVAASRAKSSFLANMSHEIRTPMNAVIGLTHRLLKTSLSTQQLDYAEKIRRSAEALLGIINDILDFSKIEAGKMVLEHIPFDPLALMDDIAIFFQDNSIKTGIALKFELDEGIPRSLMGDPLRLRQIFINLVGNSFKFTEKGCITIRIAMPQCDDTTATLSFDVQDTGIGMSKSQIAKIFVAFTQADDSVTRKYGGTGLGLSITTRLVELIGGNIDVKSKVGEGTTFSFCCTFPIDPNAASRTPTSAQKADATETENDILRGLRVLLAEDNEINTQIMLEILDDVGITTTTAENGKLALEKLEEAASQSDGLPFDVVLMDLQMPVMDGYEAAKRIRFNARYSGMPIYALTAHAFAEEKEHCLDIGMSGHLTKPIDICALYKTLRAVAQQVNGNCRTRGF